MENEHERDREIVSSLARGDMNAFEQLFHKHKVAMVAFLHRRFDMHIELAQEAYHDATMSLLENCLKGRLTSENLRGSLETYLWTIIRRRGLDFYLKGEPGKPNQTDKDNRIEHVSVENLHPYDQVHDGLLEEFEFIKDDLREYIKVGMGLIRQGCEDLLRQFFWERKSYETMADGSSVTSKTIGNRVEACLTELRSLFGSFGTNEEGLL